MATRVIARPRYRSAFATQVTETIVKLHNRTVHNVVDGLNLRLVAATRDDEMLLLESDVMNVGLSQHVAVSGAADAIWRAE